MQDTGPLTRLCRIAGPESVATILRVAIVYIIGTPRVYRKLMAEISEKERLGLLSSPATYEEAKNMPFMAAIVKEVFRIHPPIGYAISKH